MTGHTLYTGVSGELEFGNGMVRLERQGSDDFFVLTVERADKQVEVAIPRVSIGDLELLLAMMR